MSLGVVGQVQVGRAGQVPDLVAGQVLQDGRLLGLGKEADWVVGGAFFGFAAGIIQLLANRAIQVNNSSLTILHLMYSTSDFVSGLKIAFQETYEVDKPHV